MNFYLIVHILCVFRVAYMFVEEQGPYDIFAKLRLWTIKKRIIHILPFTCFYCMSVWIGLIFSVLINQSIGGVALIYGLALSAGSIIVYEIINRLSR